MNEIEKIHDKIFKELVKDTNYFSKKIGKIDIDSYFELGHIYGIVERHYEESGIKLNYQKILRLEVEDKKHYEDVCDEIHGAFLNILIEYFNFTHRDFRPQWYTNIKFIDGRAKGRITDWKTLTR